MSTTEAVPVTRPSRSAPPPAPTRPPDGAPAGPPPNAVRVSRVVLRRLDPWSVLKVSVLFYLSMFVVLLTAAVLLWLGANAAGVIGNIESFMSSVGFTDFRFLPGQIFRTSAIVGLVLVVAGTAGNVLMAVLYNLISDVVGGLQVTLSDDERRPQRRV